MGTPQPTSGESREDHAAAAGATVGALYVALEAVILAAVATAVAAVIRGVVPAVAQRRMRNTLAAEIAATETRSDAVLAEAATQARAEVAAITARDLGEAPAVRDLEHLAGRLTDRAVTPLKTPGVPAVSADLHAAGLFAFRRAQDVYRQAVTAAMAQRTAIGAKVRDLEGLPRAQQSLSRLQAAQKVLDQFAEKGVTGFTDSAGRSWDLAAYAEMATRTSESRLHLALQVQQMGPLGVDLAIVDNPSHMPPCPKCLPWEGRVISLTGGVRAGMEASATDAHGGLHTVTVKGSLAEAKADGLFHPNCRHSLLPFTDSAGMMPLAGGPQRPYIEGGQPAPAPLPITSPGSYDAEQKLRAHERRVRAARRVLAASASAGARTSAKRRLGAEEAKLREHVARTGVLRRPRREKIRVAR